MDNCVILPDGSAFGVLSMPLPEDHWLYQRDEHGFTGPPPMTFRMEAGEAREQMAERIREAAKWAIRASTMCGRDEDFDPDAMVQNMVVGLLGYHTADGLSGEAWDTPAQVPPLHRFTHA